MWTPIPGNLASMRAPVVREKVPPPTPVELPAAVSLPCDEASDKPLSTYLQSVHRPIDLEACHLAALGLRVTADATMAQLVPNPDLIPDFAAWDTLSPDEARETNDSTRVPLCITNRSPGCQTYLDRKREFSYSNADAFRTVRRLQPVGAAAPKLGGSYDFWRCLEVLTMYWDDPTEAATPAEEDTRFLRSSNGETMPHIHLQTLAASLIKLVAYEFGCSVAPGRLEPRLTIISPPETPSSQRRCSTIPSSCHFVYRSATTRATARAGIVDGPLAAISVRQNLSFQTEFDSTIDLAREVVAVLLTAQQRARQGKTEKRFGEGEWWATKPRWGGGPGGPIGREVDKYDVPGDKDDSPAAAGQPRKPRLQRPERKSSIRSHKTLSIYDNYRSVRPPATTWDPKTRYEAIGKVKGADYDDIYVISVLVHHISIVRFRVPDKLLEVLDGGADNKGSDTWDGLCAWRSPWLDLFVVDERVRALQILWAVMGYLMRREEGQDGEDGADGKKDVEMTNAI